MKPIYYWGMICLVGILHLLFILIPIYITCFIVIGITYFLQRKILIQISYLGVKWNSFLIGIQILLVSVYLLAGPSWINLILFLIFISIEIIRVSGARKIFVSEKEKENFKEQREQFNETFRIVRSERHDFLKHISALHFMLENDNTDQARNYLSNLVEGYEETNLSIKGEKGVVAGILHQMYRRAKSAGIEVIYDLDLPLSTLPLSDKDIVTLMGNLLSNAIDACEEWQQKYNKKANLTLQFYKRSGLFLLICKNQTLPIPIEILDELYHSYGNTTKGNDHEGLGTKLIQDIINEYQGFLDFVHKDEEFTVKIKIPAIR